MNISWIISILVIAVVDTASACSDGSDCPGHLPYCTPVGCVYSCPNNTFMNRSTCVEDCGTDFIFRKSCIDRCPSTHSFVIKRVLASQLQFHALNYCVEKCPQDEFAYERTCLEACPFDHYYVLDGACNKKCPMTHGYRRNLTKDGRLVAVECLSSCYYPTPVKRGQLCIQQCEPPLHLYKEECLDVCPEHAELLYIDNSYGSKTIMCEESCPHGTYILNGICQSHCPSNYSLYNDSVCVDACPQDMPYIDRKYQVYDSKGLLTYRFGKPVSKCVHNCPDNTYVDDGRCTSKCSGEKKIFNSTCVNSCPQDMLVYDSNGFCKQECSSYNYGNLCVDQCPSDTVLVNTSCEKSCPPSVPFMCDKASVPFCRQNIYELDNPMIYCVHKCPDKTYVDDGRCTSKCSGKKKSFNSTCVDSCPLFQPYVTLTSPYYHEAKQYECVSQCPSTLVLENSTCVDMCSENMYVLEMNRTCIASCPFPEYVIKNMQCLNNCPSLWYNESGKCVKTCTENYVFNNTCVEHCPYSHPLLEETTDGSKKWHCRVICPQDWFTENKTCVRECSDKVIFNATCVTQCPGSHPYFKDKDHLDCVEACDKGQITLNRTCISPTECKNIVYNNKCLQKCPKGTFWSSTTTGSTCIRTIGMLFFLEVSVILCIMWLFCCRKYFTTTEKSSLLFRLLCCIGIRKEVRDDDLWVDDNDDDSEDVAKDNGDKNITGTDVKIRSTKRSTRSGGNDSEEVLLLLQCDSDEETENIHLVDYEPNVNNAVSGNDVYYTGDTNAAYGIENNMFRERADGEIVSHTLGGDMGYANSSPGIENNHTEVKVVIERSLRADEQDQTFLLKPIV